MPDFDLAQVNIGRLAAPLDSPELADFVAQLPTINALADNSPGFVWRLVDDGGADATALRPDGTDDLLLVNCSTWQSIEALRAFTYHSDHLRVLARRRDWFVPLGRPHQALWWVPSGHRPTVPEAMDRVERVRTHGPGPEAFTFREVFPAPVGVREG
jgi:hypothetical protein